MPLTYYDNRELSWLKFNERVLEESQDESVPLCERLLFSSIFQSNLDEFFMVRVGSLHDQMLLSEDFQENKTLMTCREQLSAIFSRVRELSPLKDETYNKIISSLSVFGVVQVDFNVLSKNEENYLQSYFNREIKPLISPQIIDKRNPFPFIRNKEIYVAAHIESKSSVRLGIIPSSGVFQRVIFLPSDKIRFMLVEDLILHYAPLVFENYHILEKSLIRVTRNADISADEALYDHDVDFRDTMEELIKLRKKLAPVRLELSRSLGQPAMEYLCDKLELEPGQVFHTSSPLDLSFVSALGSKLADRLELFFPVIAPQKSPCINENETMAAQIQRKDILLSYPYESIKPFIRLLNEVVNDPYVVSVKITLYRVAKNSKVIEALINIAESGKNVLVLVELRARFDEENNIEWSKRLQDAGCTVIYGLNALKVHSKLLLITRKVSEKVQYITQIGTGNYNEKTATLYTDLSLMTADTNIGIEAGSVFNALSMGNCIEKTEHLLVAPLCLQNKVLEFIDKEIDLAKSGELGYVGAKLNSLTDKIIIDKLVEASCAGVQIQLVVRGICCLIAGVPGFTENITVTSIVGRFLEHSRIYIFGTAERKMVYISSADFMTRNTIRRVEVATPIYDINIKNRILEMFKIMLRDNVKARCQDANGDYRRKIDSGAALSSQEYFYTRAVDMANKIREDLVVPTVKRKRIFGKFKDFIKFYKDQKPK